MTEYFHLLRFPIAGAGFAMAALVLAAHTPVQAQAQAPAQAKPPSQSAAPQDPAADPNARLGRIEEQLTDLQVAVGALEASAGRAGGKSGTSESLPWAARANKPAPQGQAQQPGAATGDASLRLSAVETQIRALTGEIERISHSLRQIRTRLNLPTDKVKPGAGMSSPSGYGMGFSVPRAGGIQQDSPHGAVRGRRPRDVLGGGRLGGRFSTRPAVEPRPAQAPAREPAVTANSAAGRILYESGYGAYLRGDNKAATQAFSQFLKEHPGDVLAGNAQYWLGESFFARGQFKKAADAFLKGYTEYKGSTKAPDSLLKLGMSLGRLKQRDAACSTFAELAVKFPNARQNVLARAKQEARRANCR